LLYGLELLEVCDTAVWIVLGKLYAGKTDAGLACQQKVSITGFTVTCGCLDSIHCPAGVNTAVQSAWNIFT